MLEKEFNKAKNNIINLFNRCRVLDTVKLSEIKNLKKAETDQTIDLKEVIKIDKLKLDMSKTKLVEYEYTKVILANFIKKRYPSMSNVEQKVLVNNALKKVFNLKVDIDQHLKTKEDLIQYAFLIKTSLYGYPLSNYLNGSTLEKEYGEEIWKHFINLLETHEIKIKNNPTAKEDLLKAQNLLACNVLEDLAKSDDVADYIVMTQYILNTPVSDDVAMSKLIYQYDLEFVRNNGIKDSKGLAKIYTLRDTLTAISDTEADESSLKYIAEFNNLVKAFNSLKRSSSR